MKSFKGQLPQIICILVLIPLILCSCANTSVNKASSDSSAFQELYDRSCSAKEYTDKQINNIISASDSRLTVIESAYGFITAETPYYIVGYKYSDGSKEFLYGYKVSVDDTMDCTILEEGESIADTLFS